MSKKSFFIVGFVAGALFILTIPFVWAHSEDILMFLLQKISKRVDAMEALHKPTGWNIDLWQACWSREGLLDFTAREWTDLSKEKQFRLAAIYQKWYARQFSLSREKVVTINMAYIEMMLVPPGKFWMGSSENKRQTITIEQPFYMSKCEVIQAQWTAVMGNNPNQNLTEEQRRQFCEKIWMSLATKEQCEYALTFNSKNESTTLGFRVVMDIQSDISTGHCKSIFFSNPSSSSLQNYQVRIPVTYNISAPSLVCMEGKCKKDFSDLRFADTNGVMLSYWKESFIESEKATFWVKIPILYANTENRIYVYYGNPKAEDASDGDKTFELFDDFLGSKIDENKWAIVNKGNNEAKVDVLNSICDVYVENGAGYVRGMKSKKSFESGTAIRAKIKIKCDTELTCGCFGYQAFDVSDSAKNVFYPQNQNAYLNHGPGDFDYRSARSFSLHDFHICDLIRLPNSGLQAYYDDTLVIVSDTSQKGSIPVTFSPYIKGHFYIDWVFVRKCSSPEPEISKVYNEN